jgi:hypothetical protein
VAEVAVELELAVVVAEDMGKVFILCLLPQGK